MVGSKNTQRFLLVYYKCYFCILECRACGISELETFSFYIFELFLLVNFSTSQLLTFLHWYNFYADSSMAKPVFTTKSSTIHKVDYNEKEKTMEIEFRSGNVYRYYDVPQRMWKIFQLYIECEGSAGSFFNEYLKNQFTSEKVSGNETEG
jgi:hypothetical protein